MKVDRIVPVDTLLSVENRTRTHRDLSQGGLSDRPRHRCLSILHLHVIWKIYLNRLTLHILCLGLQNYLLG